MKIVGIILICIQVLAFVGGEGLLGMGIVGLAVFCLPGIIGIILLVKSKKKSNGNKPKLNFNEYVSSLSNEQRANVLKYCEKFGDANQVLRNLLDTPPCYQTQKDEYRINKDFLLWYFRYNSKKYYKIIKIDSIAYCYHSYYDNRGKIGMIFNDGSFDELHLDNEESVVIFAELKRYVQGFENIKPYNPFEQPDINFPQCIGLDRNDMIRGNTLYCVRKKILSGKTKEVVIIPDIRTAVWCKQYYFTGDSDSSDGAYLYIYLCNHDKPEVLLANTEREAFEMAIELKKRVPHLMYGPNKTYEEIFKRNPAELMDLAKSKMNSPQDK